MPHGAGQRPLGQDVLAVGTRNLKKEEKVFLAARIPWSCSKALDKIVKFAQELQLIDYYRV